VKFLQLDLRLGREQVCVSNYTVKGFNEMASFAAGISNKSLKMIKKRDQEYSSTHMHKFQVQNFTDHSLRIFNQKFDKVLP